MHCLCIAIPLRSFFVLLPQANSGSSWPFPANLRGSLQLIQWPLCPGRGRALQLHLWVWLMDWFPAEDSRTSTSKWHLLPSSAQIPSYNETFLVQSETGYSSSIISSALFIFLTGGFSFRAWYLHRPLLRPAPNFVFSILFLKESSPSQQLDKI